MEPDLKRLIKDGTFKKEGYDSLSHHHNNQPRSQGSLHQFRGGGGG